MHSLDTLIRLNNQIDRGGIRLTFITIAVLRRTLDLAYPGGVRGFLAVNPHARQEGGLVTVSAMSGTDIDEVLRDLAGAGIDPDSEVAIGDQFGGPFQTCPGIEFYASRPDRPHAQRWVVATTRGEAA